LIESSSFIKLESSSSLCCAELRRAQEALMADDTGKIIKCAFCPNTQDVIKTVLGEIETDICKECIRKLIESAAEQGVDVVGLGEICKLQGGTLTLQYLEFKKTLNCSGQGGNPVHLADSVADFFREASLAIASGKLTAVRDKKRELIAKRQEKEAAEKHEAALVVQRNEEREVLVGVKAKLAELTKTVEALEAGAAEQTQELEETRLRVKAIKGEEEEIEASLSKALGEEVSS